RPGAEAALRRSLELEPGGAEALCRLAQALRDRPEEALAAAGRAAEGATLVVASAGDGQRHRTPETAARKRAALSTLPVPCGRPFTLGTRRLELVATGGVIGGAGLLVEVDGRRVFYAGSVCPRGVGLGGRADVRRCDVLVLAAVHGGARFDPAAAAAAAVDFAVTAAAAGATPVLLVASASRGLDVAGALAAAGLPARAHRDVHHAARRLAPLGVDLPPLRRAAPRRGAAAGEALIWMVRRRGALARLALERPRIALVSGAAADRSAVAEAGAEAGFAWSSHGDRDDLVAYIEAAGAAEVLLTGRAGEALAAALDGRGRSVRTLGPPHQMDLFA
ncbi:MAG TPA: hypothetical protein VL172_09735, partial [Kofleriaceae bacterium]|nr:hypothetical protein [Kofleriaceae bacterium]